MDFVFNLWYLLIPAAAILLFLLKPRNKGNAHAAYFQTLNDLLKQEGPGRPALLLDLDRLDEHINTLKKHIQSPERYRVVAKSLPSLPLIKHIFKATGTRKLMVFHEPFLSYLVQEIPDRDFLLGKPMPAQTVERFYDKLGADAAFRTMGKLQWLIDTGSRARQYLEIARKFNLVLNLNIEIDVGLHRGGVASIETLKEILDIIQNEGNHLRLSGFMGYEPHVAKAPPVLSSYSRAKNSAMKTYGTFTAFTKENYPDLYSEDLIFNAGGSMTYQLYKDTSLINELCTGSALVLPTDFDLPTLQGHKPALFIAAPVLKILKGIQIPFIEFLSGFMAWWNPNRALSMFMYGGYWKARAVSPAGLEANSIYGHSSNQEIINGSSRTNIEVDDYIFLRPTQSEAVMLQFGDLLVLKAGVLQEKWEVFPQGGERSDKVAQVIR